VKTRISSTINIGAFSGVTVNDFYSVCSRYDVDVISCNKIGGLLVKTYQVTVEGTPSNLKKVALVFKG
jgi:hypothetical protein